MTYPIYRFVTNTYQDGRDGVEFEEITGTRHAFPLPRWMRWNRD